MLFDLFMMVKTVRLLVGSFILFLSIIGMVYGHTVNVWALQQQQTKSNFVPLSLKLYSLSCFHCTKLMFFFVLFLFTQLYLKVFAEDDSSKCLLADERMTVGRICQQMAQKNHISLGINYCIIEHMPQLYLGMSNE